MPRTTEARLAAPSRAWRRIRPSVVKDSVFGALAWMLLTRVSRGHPGVTPWWARRLEAAGFHLLPVHYYTPVPDSRSIPESFWSSRSSLLGVDLRIDEQLRMLRRFAEKLSSEYDSFPERADGRRDVPRFYSRNEQFECVDPEIYYSLIRELAPRRIIEIGGGFSTLVAAQAVTRSSEENGSYDCELAVIEPYPRDFLRRGFPGLSRLIHSPIQEIDCSLFEGLEANDILFIDSTHTVKPYGDVVYELLEIVPRLRPGVLVHFHDIFLPSNLPRQWPMRLLWSEQYILQAFLAFNRDFEVVWSGSHLHASHSEELKRAIPAYRKRLERDPAWVGPGSFWIRRRRA